MDEEAEARAEHKRLRSETDEVEAVIAQCVARPMEEEACRLEAAQVEKQRQEAERKRLEQQQARETEARRQEEERQEVLEAEDARWAAQRARGVEYDYFLSNGEVVERNFDEGVTCVAINGAATVMLYEHGGWAYTSGLPTHLHNKLNGRQRTLPSPTCVALGTQDRYYIRFADGKSQWVGCEAMGDN
jgi:hypothetical protein